MRFHFHIGGYFCECFELVLEGADLRVFLSQFPEPSRFEAPICCLSLHEQALWQPLVCFLDHSRWAEEYTNGALDGVQWQLVYENGMRKIVSSGSNVYPKVLKELLCILKQMMEPQHIHTLYFRKDWC